MAVFFAPFLSCKGGSSKSQQADPPLPVKLGELSSFPVGRTEVPVYRIMVIREKGDQDVDSFRAISMVCTHQTCALRATPDKGFLCPCHGSRFSPEGKVKLGPARDPLPWLKLERDADNQLLLFPDQEVAANWRLRLSPQETPPA